MSFAIGSAFKMNATLMNRLLSLTAANRFRPSRDASPTVARIPVERASGELEETEGTRDRGKAHRAHERGRMNRARDPQGRALGRNRQVMDFRARIATSETSAEFQIVTDEGDIVTLNARSESEVTYASLRQRSKSPEGTSQLKGDFRQESMEREFNLTVEGDLNEEELADIRRLLDEIGPALKALAANEGEGYSFQPDAASFGSLSSFEFQVEHSFSITRIHVRRMELGRVAPPPDATVMDAPDIEPTPETDSGEGSEKESTLADRLAENLESIG